MKCYKCGEPEGKGPRELRPYGPKGEMVCYECAMKQKDITDAMFAKQLEAAGPIVVIDGSNVGPYPLRREHAKDLGIGDHVDCKSSEIQEDDS